MSEGDEINIERWIVLERLRLDEFVAFWTNGMAGHNDDGLSAEAFPSKMEVGDWDEQYRGWGAA